MDSSFEALHKVNDYFKSILDLIPASSYFKKTQNVKNNNKNTNHGSEEETSMRKRKLLAKKRKFDPSSMKTTSEQIILQETASGKKRKVENVGRDSMSITALQMRLREKISEMQTLRNPKNRSEEEITKIRERRKKEKVKFKMRKKLKTETLAIAGRQGGPCKNICTGTSSFEVQKSSSDSQKHILNTKGKVVFSKFDFGEELREKSQSKKNTEKHANAKKKLSVLLSLAKSKKKKMESLKSSNSDKADDKVKKDSWDKALVKASGGKVRDDVDLLKKSLNKERQIKRQHAKKWKEREQNVQEKQLQKQQRRAKNIQARKDLLKDKKLAKRKKKLAKSAPGF